MSEKQFLIIKIVDGGIRPLCLKYSEVKELLKKEPDKGISTFINESDSGDYHEFTSGYIIEVN